MKRLSTRLSALALALILLLSAIPFVSYASDNPMLVMRLYNTKAYLDQKEIRVDPSDETVFPFTLFGKTMVPVRFIEQLGATVKYNGTSAPVTVTYGVTKLTLTFDSSTMTKEENGKTSSVKLPTAPTMVEGKTCVPIREVAEGLGFWVKYDADSFVIVAARKKPDDKAYTECLAFGKNKLDKVEGRSNEFISVQNPNRYVTVGATVSFNDRDFQFKPYDTICTKRLYESNNTKVATVTSQGVIKALAVGKAEITITSHSGRKTILDVNVRALADMGVLPPYGDRDISDADFDQAYNEYTNKGKSYMLPTDTKVFDEYGIIVTGSDPDRGYYRDYRLSDYSIGLAIIGKNEIYARRGMIFSDPRVQAYFQKMSWYKGTVSAGSFSESVFNSNERKNLETMNKFINSLIRSEHDDNADENSYSAVNQKIRKPSGWKQIVQNSSFKLGEQQSSSDVGQKCTYGSYPNIDGSTVAMAMIAEFAWQHIGLTDSADDVNGFCRISATSVAYRRLIDKSADFSGESYVTTKQIPSKAIQIVTAPPDIFIGTQPSPDIQQYANARNVTLVTKPICYDAFVFITHKTNPVDSLTPDQIRRIYTGEITNWKQVGGKDEKIVAYQRNANSGSQTAMENLIMGGRNMIAPNLVQIEGMSSLVTAVAEYRNYSASIGYTYKYYIDNLYKDPNIKIISINNIAPTDENIRSKTYPFTDNYYGVIRKGDEAKTGGKFLDWMLSDEGQACIRQAGYITIK